MVNLSKGMTVHAHCEQLGQSREFVIKEVQDNGRLLLEADLPGVGKKLEMDCKLVAIPGVHLDVTDRKYSK